MVTGRFNNFIITAVVYKTLLLLTAIGLSQGAHKTLSAPHPDCPEYGHKLLPHEYDCTKFYYCERGERFTNPTSCPVDTEFSATLQVCIHPTLAGCELPGYSTTAAPTEAPTEVTTQTSTEAPTQPPTDAPTQSPTELPTEPSTEAATEPQTETPTETPTQAPTELPTEVPIEQPTQPSTQTSTETTTNAPTETPTELPTEAPTQPSTQAPTQVTTPTPAVMPTQTPTATPTGLPTETPTELPTEAPTQLTTETPTELPTEEPTEPTIQAATEVPTQGPSATPTDLPTDTPIQIPTEIPIQGPTEMPTELPTKAPTQSTTETPTTEDPCEYFDNGCPVDFDIFLLLPHETSCRQFYYCVQGEKVLSKCNRGTVFNPAVQSCDHPDSIDRTCEEEDSSSEEATSTEENQSRVEIELLLNGCPVDGSISSYLPHEYYCNRFYQCVFGELVERRCGSGTHFNPETQTCDLIAVVGCTLPGDDASSSEEDEETTEEAITTTRAPMELLENGCPADGHIQWLVPHEDDCTKFYNCVWGRLVEITCPGNLHFSFELQRCENPSIAGCICNETTGTCNNDVSECTGDDCGNDTSECKGENCDNNVSGCTGENCDNDVSECTGDNCDNDASECTGDICDNNVSGCIGANCNNVTSEEDFLEDNNSLEHNCREESNEDTENNKCEEKCNIFPWAHDDCDKYWTCDGKKAKLVVCSEGLHFNPSTHTCDFACNAGCVRENVQTTAGNDGIRVFVPWNRIDDSTSSLLKLIAY